MPLLKGGKRGGFLFVPGLDREVVGGEYRTSLQAASEVDFVI
jgi:hypothetical protein